MNTPQLSPIARATALARFAKRLPINDQATANAAGIELNALKTLRDDMRGVMSERIGPLKERIESEKAKYSPAIAVVEETMVALRGKLGAYTLEQQRIEAEARAAATARIAEIAASTQRELTEVTAKFEDAVQATTDDDAGGVPRAAAEPVAQAGLAAAASAIAQKSDDAVQAELASLPSAAVTGIRTTRRLDFRLDDMLAMVRFVATNPEFIGLLAPSVTGIRAEIKRRGLETRIDGITVFPVNTVITTGRTE